MRAIVFIPLTLGKVAVIDFEDFEKVRGQKWQALSTKGVVWYAYRPAQKDGKRRTVLLHRLVWGEENIPSGFEIAHKDGDGLNCQRYNLQCLTHQQNLWGKQTRLLKSTGGFRGVSWHKAGNSWQAQITNDGKNTPLGLFKTIEEAARAFDTAAIKSRGEFAELNFPKQNAKE